MTPIEREQYRNEKCHICDKLEHIAPICWYNDKQFQSEEIPYAHCSHT